MNFISSICKLEINLNETFSNSLLVKTLLSIFSKLFLFLFNKSSTDDTSNEDIYLTISKILFIVSSLAFFKILVMLSGTDIQCNIHDAMSFE